MRKLAKTCWWETDWSDTSLQKYHSVIKSPNLKAKKDKKLHKPKVWLCSNCQWLAVPQSLYEHRKSSFKYHFVIHLSRKWPWKFSQVFATISSLKRSASIIGFSSYTTDSQRLFGWEALRLEWLNNTSGTQSIVR